MKNIFAFIAAQFLFGLTYAYALPGFHWGVDIGTTGLNELNATAFDNSGNVYATGSFDVSIDVQPGPGIYTLNTSGGTDMYLVKYNSAGNVVWAFNLPGTNTVSSNENGYGISTDNAGNVYVTGSFVNTVDFDPGAGTSALTTNLSAYDAFVAKYDGNGNYLWAFKVGGMPSATGRDLQVDANGDLVVIGMFGGTTDFDPGAGTYPVASNGNEDAFVAKYNAGGNFLWAFSIGGTGLDHVRSVDTDAAGNIAITGNYTQTIDFNPGPGSNMVAGGTDHNLFLASYDAAGNYRWAFGLGDTQTDLGSGTAFDNTGNIILTGEITGTVDLDPGAGVFNLTTPLSYVSALLLAKYSNSGQFIMGFSLGGTNTGSSGRAVDTDPWGNIYLTGYDMDDMDYDPGGSVYSLTSYASPHSFLACYSSTGTFQWAFGHITAVIARSFGTTVQVDPNNNAIVFGGIFAGTFDLDPDSTATYDITGMGKNNGFIGYYTYEGVIKSVNEHSAQNFSVWPNPAEGILHIMLDATGNDETCIEVYNSTGAIIRRIVTQERSLQIDLSNEASGVYYVRCSSGIIANTQKFIIE